MSISMLLPVERASPGENAYSDLHEALKQVKPGDEVRVAQGCYRPAMPNGDRLESFSIYTSVTILGGYAGLGEEDADQRDFEKYRTILSGDLNGNDIEVDHPSELMTEISRSENSYHVVVFRDTGGVTLDGFTISGGWANGEAADHKKGGAITFEENYGGLTIQNCKIENNSALQNGGAVYFEYYRDSIAIQNCIIEKNSSGASGGGVSFSGDLINCVIRNNYADSGGGLHVSGKIVDCTIENNSAAHFGGGVEVIRTANFIDCIIRNNSAESGGGLSTIYESPLLERCVFTGNSATGNGGAVFSNDCSTCTGLPRFYSCLFVDNSCGGNGGAVYESGDDKIRMVNCTIWNNTAGGNAGGVYVTSQWYRYWLVANCIIWGNSDQSGSGNLTAQIYPITDEQPTDGYLAAGFRDCCIQGWPDDENDNIGLDPMFIETSDPYDLHFPEDSPCVNAGNKAFYPAYNDTGTLTDREEPLDLDGNWRLSGSSVDLGAYEVQIPRTWYVDSDPNSTRPATGMSWEDAFVELEHALVVAYCGDEIRVAQGTYKPAQHAGNRNVTFVVKDAMKLKGGYAGKYSENPDDRNIALYKTVLSGDILGDDNQDTPLAEIRSDETRSDNCQHVLTVSGTGPDTLIEGFTITAGHCYDTPRRGSGIFNDGGSPTIAECIITRNAGNYDIGGAGMANLNNASPKLIRCKFIENNASWPGGGGMSNYLSSPTLIECDFIGNQSKNYETGYAEGSGGAIENNGGSCTLIDCNFIENFAPTIGGAICNSGDHESNVKLIRCTFRQNKTNGYGGAIYHRGSYWTSDPLETIKAENCLFVDNDAEFGGALYLADASDPVLSGCSFTNNSASDSGGGVYNSSQLEIVNCSFYANSAVERGGAVLNEWIDAAVNNCTFTLNTAKQGGAIAGSIESDVTITNSILWDNHAEAGSQLHFTDPHYSCDITISHCNIQGGRDQVYFDDGCNLYWLDGNIEMEPMFADLEGGDLHLKSQAGHWDDSSNSWVLDDISSPCIDAGNMASSIGLELFPNGGIVNMGAYGATLEASKTFYSLAPCEKIIVGDLNGDCKVNSTDLALMAFHWLENGE